MQKILQLTLKREFFAAIAEGKKRTEYRKRKPWLSQEAKVGVLPHELAVFVRSSAQLDRARAALTDAGIPFKVLDEHVETVSGHAALLPIADMTRTSLDVR